MRKILLAAVAISALAVLPASAGQITQYAQNGLTNTLVASNPTATTTHLSVLDASVNIAALLNSPALPNAFFNFSADNDGAAIVVAGAIVAQHFNGTFCLSTLAGCGGVDLLSGTFTDAALGKVGGPGLVININNPPDTLTLISDIIPANLLISPNTFDLSLSNIAAPGLSVSNGTITAFTASYTGTLSASEVPEPASLGLLGVGLLGLGLVANRRRVA